MVGNSPRLEWSKLGHGSTQWNGRLGKEMEFQALFILRQRGDDGWVLLTSLPAHYWVGAFGMEVASFEAGKKLAEEALTAFYREMKRHMEPKRTPAQAGGKGGDK